MSNMCSILCPCLFALALPLSAAISVSLSPNLSSPRPLGTTVVWTATVTDSDAGAHTYRFNLRPTGGTAEIRKDYSPSNKWDWTPADYEGTFRITVTVRNMATGTSASAAMEYMITTRLINGNAAVNPTSHPLVALFSGPACLAPNRMRVHFRRQGATDVQTTHAIPCRTVSGSGNPDMTSLNFYIAGMYASSTYLMNWETIDPGGATVKTGSEFSFTTGSIPASVPIPARSVVMAPPAGSEQRIVLQSFSPLNNIPVAHTATDLQGNVLWYYPVTNNVITRTNPDGTIVLLQKRSPNVPPGLHEVDLAGNVVRQTTVDRVNEQLVAMGFPRITNFNHDARRINNPGKPNHNYFVVICGTDIVSTQHQGGTPSNPVDIIGDAIVVLNQNMQVVWAWNPFIHLDLSRRAVLDEKCYSNTGACRPMSPGFTVANDWMHTNSVQHTPWDGNLIISMRHQDWVVKINYADGLGDGSIVWRMGRDGDFSVTTAGTQTTHDADFPWFSHQHDAEFELRGQVFGGSRVMTIFDNGNTRATTHNPSARSRCQSFAVNEAGRAVNLNINADEGVYAVAVGSAQLMKNGHLTCDNGALPSSSGTYSRTIQNEKNGNLVYIQQWQAHAYRSYRMDTMYSAVTP